MQRPAPSPNDPHPRNRNGTGPWPMPLPLEGRAVDLLDVASTLGTPMCMTAQAGPWRWTRQPRRDGSCSPLCRRAPLDLPASSKQVRSKGHVETSNFNPPVFEEGFYPLGVDEEVAESVTNRRTSFEKMKQQRP